jgi:peptidoglycan/xylan/chitin deacetylase (PgdA/CDA1 family)
MTPHDLEVRRRMPADGTLRRLRRRLAVVAEVADEPWDLLCGRYPNFVYHDTGDAPGHVPVFFWHGVEPVGFEQRLRYLADNDYSTLTLDELAHHLADGAPVPDRSVVLTFDDGKLSVWQFAAPLLEKYRMHATVFVIPGYVGDGSTVRPSLTDVWAGRCTLDTLDHGETVGPLSLMNWAELRALAADGHVAVESHTLHHRRVFTSDRLVDYCTPTFPDEFHDVPIAPGTEHRWRDDPPDAPYGLPLYDFAPLTVTNRMFRDDPDLRVRCLEHVRRGGGWEFFTHVGWRRELGSVVRGYGRYRSDRATAEETIELMTHEFAEARSLIRVNIPGARADHLCYPYGAGSARAVDVARHVGYQTGSWLLPPGRRTNRPGDDPHQICRIKNDWIFSLPGTGRSSCIKTVINKVRRRATRDTTETRMRRLG